MWKFAALSAFPLLVILTVGCSGEGGITPAAGDFSAAVGPFDLDLHITDEGRLTTALTGPAECMDSLQVLIVLRGQPDLADEEESDVVIEGSFISPTRAEGTIRALTDEARDCGVPDEEQWVAEWSPEE